MASSSSNRLSREDYRKQQELNEARKNGELPPEQDEDGNLINPHIPEFMSKAPWYLNQDGPGLKHQKRFRKEHTQSYDGLHAFYKRGVKKERATRYRKGACKNCGAITHKEKECTEKPRKVGAWKTNKNIAADELLPQQLNLTWDGKRDSYKGYEASAHALTVARYNAAEMERRKFRQAERDKKFRTAPDAQHKKHADTKAGGGKAGSGGKAGAKLVEGDGTGAGAGGGAGAGAGAGAVDDEDKDGSEGAGVPVAKQSRKERRAARKAAAAELKAKRVAERKAAGKSGSGDDSDSDDSLTASDSDSDSDSDYSSSDEDDDMADVREKETQSAVGSHVQRYTTKAKMSVRNLRLREDKPKYLRNLDPNSAFYDPHTRSMRENPNPHLAKDESTFLGDNAYRVSGDAVKLAQAQIFAWEASKAGQDEVHLQANPTQVELARKKFLERKQSLKKDKRSALLDKYGGKEHLKKLPRALALGETEAYVEYSKDGRVLKGAEKAVARSKYLEDVYINNHRSVWGSWFDRDSMQWGYGCCHSLVRNSVCTGAAGRSAAAGRASVRERAMLEAAPSELAKDVEDTLPEHLRAAANYGENLNPKLDKRKLKKAIRALEKESTRRVETDDRKRGYNSMRGDYTVTAEEMEAYRLKKARREDPMANFADSGDVA